MNNLASRALVDDLRDQTKRARELQATHLQLNLADVEWLLDLVGEVPPPIRNLLDQVAPTTGRFDYIDELEQQEATQVLMEQDPDFAALVAAALSGDEDEDEDEYVD